MSGGREKTCITHERCLSVDEGLEYMTAEGKRKEELEAKLNRVKREF